MGLLGCLSYFHRAAWNSRLCFIHIHIISPPSVRVSLPGELLFSSPSSFISYFLVYVNRSKPFWAPRQSTMIKHHARSMTLKRSNILIDVFHKTGTAEMKKFTSGANGHMFSLFGPRGKKQRTKFEMNVALLAPRAFWLHVQHLSACKLKLREESVRKNSEKFHYCMFQVTEFWAE